MFIVMTFRILLIVIVLCAILGMVVAFRFIAGKKEKKLYDLNNATKDFKEEDIDEWIKKKYTVKK